MAAPKKEKLAETSIWCDIPLDILINIAQRLKQAKDFLALGAVCKAWRPAASKEYFKGLWWLREEIPYLMLPVPDDKEDTRGFYSLYDGKIVASVASSKFKNTDCLESLGWLLLSGKDGSMCLFDPFSNMEIPLPPQTTLPNYTDRQFELLPHVYVQKMVLSSRPISETSDFIVMIIWGCMSYLGYWKPGDQAWNKIGTPLGWFRDVTYHSGHFYAIHNLGFVLDFNLEQNNQQVEGRIVTCLIEDDGFNYMNKLPSEICSRVVLAGNDLVRNKTLYILGSYNGSLLLIARTSEKWNREERRRYKSTTEFHVYEVDVHTGLWREIHTLGNMAIFIGYSSTVSVDASRFPAFVEANHIYFTDDDWQSYFLDLEKKSGEDIGVYDLNTGKVHQFYLGELLLNNISPSIWITPYF